jgi:NADPH:quinone reductase-like Zn-dependent oxidoreductase
VAERVLERAFHRVPDRVSTMISTDAWVLHRGDAPGQAGQLVREAFSFPEPGPEQVLARPLYGCWEGNMDHAIRRVPVDVCELRNEDRVVLGNSGVVEVVRTGSAVTTVRAGDVGVVFCNGVPDDHGYPTLILGYDAPGTMGVLAKTITLHQRQIVPVPRDSPYSLAQWAAFSLRYITAWANWQVAWGCWQTQMREVPPDEVFVCGWGGGVSLAELTLARAMGCRTAMIASTPARLALLRDHGIEAIDRSAFGAKTFEDDFLAAIRAWTGGRGVSIFVDNIGANYRSTLKALGRQGVIATSGWKRSMNYSTVRAMECIARHIHVFTHYARYPEGQAAVAFALAHGWMPPLDGPIYRWDDVPALASDYAAGKLDGYFPIFEIHGEPTGAA